MSTIAQIKQQVDRIWVASFQTDSADTLTDHLRRQALLGVQAALETALGEERAIITIIAMLPAKCKWRYRGIWQRHLKFSGLKR